MMNIRSKSLSGNLGGILFVLLLAVFSARGQSPTPPSKQLTDDQAQTLTKKLSAAPAASRPLTAAETQKLLQYLSDQAARQTASAQASAAAAEAPKAQKAKLVRIGLVMPRADLGPGIQSDSVAEPLRALMTRYLTGPMVELVPLDALVTQQIDAEAQAKQCDFVLYSAVSQKKTGGMGMGLFKGATTFANMVPGAGAVKAAGGMLGAAGSVASAASAAQEAGDASKGVKAKSEVSFEYKLLAFGKPAAVLSATIKAKAATDGEDVMTPLVATKLPKQLSRR